MALQSEVSPSLIGDPNKDTQIEGDTKSDENESSTEEEVDLEEGEILDSEAEEERDFTNSSLKEALDKSCLQNIEELINQAKKAAATENLDPCKPPMPHKPFPRERKIHKYTDHDAVDENGSGPEDGWVKGSPKHKSSKFDSNKTMDYRMELAAYRGTPPSSPDRKKRDKDRKKRSSKKSKKTRKVVRRKDIKGQRVGQKYIDRTKICKFYKEGKCAKGADCPYTHASPSSFKKKELCRFYLNGHCNKGNDCFYMHEDFPCKFYHTGSECYAKADCRFSHTPLTDEMKRVLADYLRMSHGDDRLNRDDRDRHRDDRDRDRDRDRGRDHDRKRHRSHTPEPQPPAKRTCLLGSPPRHIREADETKRWQEEMKMLHVESHPSFEIRVGGEENNSTPPHITNFYQDTLQKTPSPKRRPPTSDAQMPFNDVSSENYDEEMPTKMYVYEDDELIEIEIPPARPCPPIVEEENYVWAEMEHKTQPEEIPVKKFDENSQQSLDFTNDVKFDETTQFSEMESSIDYPLGHSPENSGQATPMNNHDFEDSSEQNMWNMEDNTPPETNINAPETCPDPPAPPIVVPSHLPRRQQELFMRVLQHQRKTDLNTALASPTNNDIEEPAPVKKEEPEVTEKPEEEKYKWYSSEDEDDDDTDQPLTDVLKKIQQAPPAPVAPPQPKKLDLFEMLNEIQQKTKEKQESAKQQTGSIWDKIFGNVTKPQNPPFLANPAMPEPNRHLLLPSPLASAIKVESPQEPVIPKDPRLKSRDPRKAATVPKPTLSIPLIPEHKETESPKIPPGLASPSSASTESSNKNIPYRLLGITPKPLNYSPYIHASQGNPNLLKDPRLRKHLKPPAEIKDMNGTEPVVPKPVVPPKNAPPMPELLLKYEKPISLINIFEPSSSAKVVEETKVPMAPYDPRISRRDSRSNSNSGSDTPPHLTIVDIVHPPTPEFKSAPVLQSEFPNTVREKKADPLVLDKSYAAPVMERSYTPPIIEKNFTPQVVERSYTPPPAERSFTPPPAEKSEVPPILEKNLLHVKKVPSPTMKKEVESDSDSNQEPPPVVNTRSSPRRYPAVKEEFITVIKEEPQDTKDSHPVVPTLIIKKVKPTPASHLPRAIADPRMAKLHDRRRPTRLATADSKTTSVIESKKQSPPQPETEKGTSVAESKNSDTIPKKAEESKTESAKLEKPKLSKSIPKKRRLSDKSEEKKKSVHRNRKSSMDYASPLNSCDAADSSEKLDYNRYNQRPKRNVNANKKVPSNGSPSTLDSSDTSTMPEFSLSDSSNLDCDNSSDVNLKDRFKTIDPTASPFC